MNLTKEHQEHLDRTRMQAYLVKSGHKPLEQVPEQYRADVRRQLESEGYNGSSKAVSSLLVQWKREDAATAKKRAQELSAAGCETYHPPQAMYTSAVRAHLDACEAGQYRTAKSTAQAVAGNNADKLLAKTKKKRIRIALHENKDHEGMKRINSIAGRAMQANLTSGTVSSCLGGLVDTHKLARRVATLEAGKAEDSARIAALEAREKKRDARIAGLETRHELENGGKSWRDEARRIRTGEPSISNSALARRVGVSEGSIRKYKDDIKA